MENVVTKPAGYLINSMHWRRWTGSLMGTIVLNSILFLLLPVLLQPSTSSSNIGKRIDHVQVIRIKHKEKPVQKNVKPPKAQEKKRNAKKINKPTVTKPKKLTLPFKLNNQLESTATDFKIPLSDSFTFATSLNSVVDSGQLDSPISPIIRIPPIYPMRAKRKGIEGWVKVRFTVDEQGNISQPHIIGSKPEGVFDKSVLKCVAKWRYKPGTIEGVHVKTTIQTTVRFELE